MAATSANMSIVSCSADDSMQFQILIDLSHEPDTRVVVANVGENCNDVTGPVRNHLKFQNCQSIGNDSPYLHVRLEFPTIGRISSTTNRFRTHLVRQLQRIHQNNRRQRYKIELNVATWTFGNFDNCKRGDFVFQIFPVNFFADNSPQNVVSSNGAIQWRAQQTPFTVAKFDRCHRAGMLMESNKAKSIRNIP